MFRLNVGKIKVVVVEREVIPSQVEVEMIVDFKRGLEFQYFVNCFSKERGPQRSVAVTVGEGLKILGAEEMVIICRFFPSRPFPLLLFSCRSFHPHF